MGSILGTRVQRLEDPRLLTVGGTYVEDIDLPGATWLTYVRAPHAHARIVGIDTSAAGASPGVLAVFTADDLAAGVSPEPVANIADAGVDSRAGRLGRAVDRSRSETEGRFS